MPKSCVPSREEFVQLPLLNEFLRGRPAFLHFFLLVQEAARRQHDPAHVARRMFDRVRKSELRTHVVLGDKSSVHVAGADAQFQHHRSIRRFRKLERLFDGLHDRRKIRPRIEQPHLRFHGERVRALLHDAGAFAVILADDDQRAAGNSAGSQIRQRVARHVGSHCGFERHRSAQADNSPKRPVLPRPSLPKRCVRSELRVLAEWDSRRPARPSGGKWARPDTRPRRQRPDCSSAFVTARMPSPRNSSPAPRRSFCTSFVKNRSAILETLPVRSVSVRSLTCKTETADEPHGARTLLQLNSLGVNLLQASPPPIVKSFFSYLGTNASTRHGLPDPLTIFSGGTIKTAPFGGN